MLVQKEYHLYSGDKLIGTFKIGAVLEVHLVDGLKFNNIPFDFYPSYLNGQRNFEGNIVREWVNDRVIPSGRQNIDMILEEIGISEYDELAIFLAHDGKFTQDNFRIEPFSI